MKKIYCCPLPFLAACFLLLYALAVFLAQSPWRDISFVPHPSGVRAVSLGDAGGALEADGMYFFSAAHSLNCWDGRPVRTLILPGSFGGKYYHLENGVLFYLDMRRQYGLFAYELSSGRTERLVDFSSFPEFPARDDDVAHSAFWWADGERYYFLAQKAGTAAYAIWQTDGEGNFLSREYIPSEVRRVTHMVGEELVCMTKRYMPDGSEENGDIGLYNPYTGGWRTLLWFEASDVSYGEPIGVWEGELLVPRSDGVYLALDPQTGETEIFAQLDDPSLRLVSADGSAVYAIQNGDTLGLYRDGAFTPIGLADEFDCQAGDVLFVSGRADETFTGAAVIDLTGRPDFDGVSQYAVLPDGTVYRLYAAS